MVLPTNLSGPQSDVDNRSWHDEINTKLPGLNLPDPVEGGTGHLAAHAALNQHVNAETGSALPTNPSENDPNHELHHNTIHAYVNSLGSGGTNINLVADGTDQTSSLMSQIAAAPNGTATNPTVLNLPAGRYRIDGAVELNSRQHVILTGPVGGGFTAWTDKSSNDIGIISSGRIHFNIKSSTGCAMRWIRLEGPNYHRQIEPGRENYAMYYHYADDPEGKVYVFDHGFAVTSASLDCAIEDCYYENVYGDGIYVGNHLNGVACRNTVLRRISGRWAGRQAMGIVTAEGLLCEDVTLEWTGRSGLDVEPNHAQDRVYDATFRRCRISATFNTFIVQAAMPTGAVLPRLRNISVLDCEQIECPTTRSVFIALKGDTQGTLTVKNLYAPNNNVTGAGIAIQGPWTNVVVEDSLVSNNQSSQSSTVNPAVEATGVTGSLTLRRNTFNGRYQGFQNLYSLGTNSPTVTHCGNVWNMGASNDGACP